MRILTIFMCYLLGVVMCASCCMVLARNNSPYYTYVITLSIFLIPAVIVPLVVRLRPPHSATSPRVEE